MTATRSHARTSRRRSPQDRRSAVIPPGDDPFIIAGQGTAVAEGLAQIGSARDVTIVVHVAAAVSPPVAAWRARQCRRIRCLGR